MRAQRKFIVITDSHHRRKIYPNLARDMILTAPDQLWRADITYIRLRDEFVFLAVVLDAYSAGTRPLREERVTFKVLVHSPMTVPWVKRVVRNQFRLLLRVEHCK